MSSANDSGEMLTKPNLLKSFREIDIKVMEILNKVAEEKDKALQFYSKEFDKFDLNESNIRIDLNKELKIDESLKVSLEHAKARIEKFHKEEYKNSKFETGWSFEGELGENLGAKYDALDAVGVYVPGGKAVLISTVLMTVIPAKIAGVKRIVMVSPPPINDEMLFTAKLAGVDEVYQVGGAQAIAALTYGTESIEPVNKIVGPGNIYVTAAKKLVYGTVGIDGVYGPSDIAVLADESANPKFIAADLLSQLEHGTGFEGIDLVSLSEKLLDEVQVEMEKQLEDLKQHKTKEQIDTIKSTYSKWDFSYFSDIEWGVKTINSIAPEHLELHLSKENLEYAVPRLNTAGAIFIGDISCESLGDYLAGPSHCLPTGMTAKFSSGLQVADFVRKTSIIDFSKVDIKSEAFSKLSASVARIARAEGLEAHAKAMEIRVEGKR